MPTSPATVGCRLSPRAPYHAPFRRRTIQTAQSTQIQAITCVQVMTSVSTSNCRLSSLARTSGTCATWKAFKQCRTALIKRRPLAGYAKHRLTRQGQCSEPSATHVPTSSSTAFKRATAGLTPTTGRPFADATLLRLEPPCAAQHAAATHVHASTRSQTLHAITLSPTVPCRRTFNSSSSPLLDPPGPTPLGLRRWPPREGRRGGRAGPPPPPLLLLEDTLLWRRLIWMGSKMRLRGGCGNVCGELLAPCENCGACWAG